MSASKNQRVTQAMSAGYTEPEQIDTSVSPTKKLTPGVASGRLYDRIVLLNKKQDAELAAAPAAIRAKYAKKRGELLGKAPPEVAARVSAWLRAEEAEMQGGER